MFQRLAAAAAAAASGLQRRNLVAVVVVVAVASHPSIQFVVCYLSHKSLNLSQLRNDVGQTKTKTFKRVTFGVESS